MKWPGVLLNQRDATKSDQVISKLLNALYVTLTFMMFPLLFYKKHKKILVRVAKQRKRDYNMGTVNGITAVKKEKE